MDQQWLDRLEDAIRRTDDVPEADRGTPTARAYRIVSDDYGHSADTTRRFMAAARSVAAGGDWAEAVHREFADLIHEQPDQDQDEDDGDDLAAAQAAVRAALGESGRRLLEPPPAAPTPPGSPPAAAEPEWTGFPAAFYRSAFAPGETPRSARQPVPTVWSPGQPAPAPPADPPQRPAPQTVPLGQPSPQGFPAGVSEPHLLAPTANRLVAGTPVLPDDALDPAKGKVVGGNGAELVRVTQQIRDLMREWMAKAARGDGAGPPGRPKDDRGPGLLDALRPVTDRLMNTRAGRIAGNFWRRVAPHARPLVDRAKHQATKWAGRKLRESLAKNPPGRGASKPPGPPPGGGGSPAPKGGPAPVGAGGTAAAAEGAGAEAGAAAGAEGAMAGAGGAAAAVALPAAVLAGFTIAAVEAGKALQEFGAEAERSNQKFRGVSPSQTVIWAQLDANRMQRTMQSGENRADTSQALANAIDRLEQRAQPIADLLGQLTDLAAATGLESLGQLAEVGAELVRVLKDLYPWLKDLQPAHPPGTAWADMLDIARQADAADRRAKDALDAARRAHDGR